MKNIALSATKIFSILIVAFTLIIVLINIGTEPAEVAEVAEVETEVIEAKPVDSKQLKCLAENIFYEARGESVTGKAAVARVVMNRVNHGFASTPCNVIYQVTTVTKINEETLDEYKVRLCQFSWVCENRQKINVNDPKYIQAMDIAYQVLAYDAYHDVLPRSALFFHNLTVDPFWPYKQVARIGNHIFYSKQKVKKNDKQKSSERNI
jgi:spore germination cell wall hydrolase CwlJ-like protein